MKWLLTWPVRKERLKDFPELIPRSNDRSTYDVEMEDRATPTRMSVAVNEESEAINGHIGSPAD